MYGVLIRRSISSLYYCSVVSTAIRKIISFAKLYMTANIELVVILDLGTTTYLFKIRFKSDDK